MNSLRLTARAVLTAALVLLSLGASPADAAPPRRPAVAGPVLAQLAGDTCRALMRQAPRSSSRWSAATWRTCAAVLARAGQARTRPVRLVPAQLPGAGPDGAVLGRQRVAEDAQVVLEVVAYASDGLAVGGLLCYPNDGQPHGTVVHVHGGLGGVFDNADGDMVTTCYNWAARHGRTAFAPSLRGQDGSDGRMELCLGESSDVVNAVRMLRGIEPTGTAPVALVGGSIGGCVVLRAAPFITGLAAVVAFVPPTTWSDLITFHRTGWAPAQETLCDGGLRPWTTGGPALADTFDSIICGHAGCPADDYLARSPIAYVTAQTAPTLIVTAAADNVVPFEQQLLWSLFRQWSGASVDVVVVDPCAPPGQPVLGFDGLLVATEGHHLLAEGPISSGMLFLLGHLDRAAASR